MMRHYFVGRRRILGKPVLVLLVLASAACSAGERLASSEAPLTPTDSTVPTGDSTPGPPQGPQDSAAPPPDTLLPPVSDPPDSVLGPDSTAPPAPSGAPEHVGLAFGPAHQPTESFGQDFTGTVYTAEPSLLADLERARRANLRLFVSFTGNEQWNRDENGFSITKWKERVDRFSGIDFSSFIADGTVIGHFILDEPGDPANWNGHVVPLSQIEEMARYSKEIWPTLPTIIRAWPDFLSGHQYKYLDAVRFQYHARFGPIDQFIATHLRGAKSLGLEVVGGLNVLSGGGSDGGLPGFKHGKYSMSASQLRSWGGALLAEPSFCAIVLWEHHAAYMSRPDIKAALGELSEKARNRPKKACRN